jgi:phenylacetate-coenzyme A ligase PaaK-like adenylate-forming protein
MPAWRTSYDFYSLRYIFAGAERVRDETRKVGREKFGCASSKAMARPRRGR